MRQPYPTAAQVCPDHSFRCLSDFDSRRHSLGFPAGRHQTGKESFESLIENGIRPDSLAMPELIQEETSNTKGYGQGH